MNLVKTMDQVDKEYYQDNYDEITDALARRAWGEVVQILLPNVPIYNDIHFSAAWATELFFESPYYWRCWPQFSEALEELGAWIESDPLYEDDWLHIGNKGVRIPTWAVIECHLPCIQHGHNIRNFLNILREINNV